jgi:hypothetical protein
VLVAYFDASYNHPSSTRPNPSLLHTVGVYIGDANDWRKFRKEWQSELSRKSLPDFHMNKYERALSDTIQCRELATTNPYYGWHKEDFAPFLQRLHKVLRRKNRNGIARLEGIGVSIKKADFEDLLPDELKADEGCKSPYIFNVAANMGHVGAWANYYNYAGDIHYVFASGDGEDGHIKDFFSSCWKHKDAVRFFRLTKAVSTTGYEIKAAKDEPALQAADIAAYEFNKIALHCLENGYDIDPAALRKSVLNLCREPNNNFPLLLAGERMVKAFGAMVAFKEKHGGAFGQILPRKRGVTIS